MSGLPLIVPDWDVPARVRAYVTTRAGGVSQAPYDSLNLGAHVGDEPEAVSHNRQRLCEALELPAEPLWLEQVHGHAVARAGDIGGSLPCADASVSRQAGEVCVVMTADCLPVLFCSDRGDGVAAAHAGWRGLHGGILEATVEAMLGDGGSAGHILAWLGPAIGPDAFEVGGEVRDAFVQKLGESDEVLAAFRPSATVDGQARFLADLYALARITLGRVGVSRISGGEFCTYRDRERFYSYRRDGVTGRMASLIWIE